MGQYQQLNQFQQAPILGDTATKVNLNTLSVQIDPNSTNTLLPGDAVYMTQTTGTTILVDKCSATIAPFGYVLYNVKYDQFTAGYNVEIGLVGQIIWVEAGGTIYRGNNVEYDPSASLTTGPQVLASGGINPISGLALDNATSGELLRIIIIGTAAVSGTFSGGTINNTPIGASTPNTGNFTELTDAISSLTVSAATTSLNPVLGGLFTITPTASITINAASVPATHQRIVVTVLTSGTVSYTVTFGTNFKSTGTLTTGTVSGKYFNIVFDGNGTYFIESGRSTAE